jgi:site-specific DNA-methyltransferase (adenine-specific)
MSARVEIKLGERFNVLNNITWAKNHTKNGSIARRISKEALRSFMPEQERIIFAEHYGSDNIAKGEKGYKAKSDELRGFLFEPIREYLDKEWNRAGLSRKDANIATSSQMASHYLTRIQWAFPTKEKYEQLKNYANKNGGDYLNREYEDLRREYEDLRREYEDLRRYFEVKKDIAFTDVWTFDTVKHYKGKHPCEKPQDMLRYMIETTTRPGGVILDTFMGTGSTGIACQATGREFIGIELSPDYFTNAQERLGINLSNAA